MKMRKTQIWIGGGIGAVMLIALLILLLSGWGQKPPALAVLAAQDEMIDEPADVADDEQLQEAEPTEIPEPTATPTLVLTATATTEPTPIPEPTQIPTPTVPSGPFGPDAEDFPLGINPLTGKMALDPATLSFQPALVSITNWPINARPQAGLGSSAWVYELYIGQGMSRFLALFYGAFPGETAAIDTAGGGDGSSDDAGGGDGQQSAGLAIDNTNADSIGPIRSGRLPYEGIRVLNNGFLVMASGYSGVVQNMESYTNVYGSDATDINSAMIPASELKTIASENAGTLTEGALSGNVFDALAPEGGLPGETFWFIYNTMNQIAWRYDPAQGVYYRYADQADGKTFVRLTDRLDESNVDVANVILLYANHRYCTEKAFDIDFLNIQKAPAVLFRDGQKYDLFWTTRNGEFEIATGKYRPIRFIDDEGNPFPLKPGSTWVILVPNRTPIWEAPLFEDVPYTEAVWTPAEPEKLLYRLLNAEEAGSGVWVSRYYQSLMLYDANVCAAIR
ncbi:MAG: DUF3048 C-terminal domain-containing protein [Anaerolineae bacterium]|nr:DUF3048 C-terminal domain-containing protein [Anaerolineae bacterium]